MDDEKLDPIKRMKEIPLVLFVFKIIVFVGVLISLYSIIQITNHDGFLYKFINSPDRVASRQYKVDLKEYENQVSQQNFRKKYYPEWLNVLQDEPTSIEISKPIKPIEKESNILLYMILFIMVYSLYYFRKHFKIKNRIKGVDFEFLLKKVRKVKINKWLN